jgi:glycerophosphoryl diester phosphodiesterase
VIQLPDNIEEMKQACIRGEMTTLDASVKCGMKLPTFYKRIKQDAEAYKIYKANDDKRRKLVSQCADMDASKRNSRRNELEAENHFAEVMKQYHSENLQRKLQNARAMGLSYGYYSAMCAGLGRI